MLAGLTAAIAAVYTNALSGGFPLDSGVLILENPFLRAATWANVREIVTHDYWHPAAVNGLYRPLVTLSYLFNYSVLGNAGAAAGYHAVNIVLHAACAALAYLLLLALGSERIVAGLTAALFALHPIATEVVTNVAGRADLLAAAGVLAGLVCYIRAAAVPSRARPWLAGLALAAAVGIFSKENAVVLGLVIAAWEVLLAERAGRRRRLATGLGALVPVFAAAWLARTWVAAHEWPADSSAIDNPILEASFWSGRATAIKVIGLQLVSLIWPLRLSADYSYAQIPVVAWPPDAATVASAAVVVALLACAVIRRRRRPLIAFFIAFYFVALLPTANVLFSIGSIMADRFLYLPLVGFAGAVVAAGHAVIPADARRIAAGAFVITLGVAGVLTIRRNAVWESDATLWASTVASAPGSAKAHKAYAATLFARDPEHREIDRVLREARRAVDIRPDYAGALIDLGGYAIVKGDQQPAADARRWYRRAVVWLQRAARLERHANRRFRRQMRARGQDPATIPERGTRALYANLALAQVRLKRFPRAHAAYAAARRIDPWFVGTYVDLAATEATLGRWDDAAASLFQALYLDDRNPDVLTRLAELYRIVDPGGESLIADGPGRFRLRLDAPLVRRHRCAAFAGLRQIFRRSGLDAAATRAQTRWTDAACAQEPRARPGTGAG